MAIGQSHCSRGDLVDGNEWVVTREHSNQIPIVQMIVLQWACAAEAKVTTAQHYR
jgi:hypothetical protein